jgi:glycosyltransferase involved in cell wall biosynthesis
MSVIVVDDFTNNPNETRQFALTLDFPVVGNYPGLRTRSYADESWIPFIEKYIGEKITWFDTHPFSYNGAFQYCVASDGNSWIHRDCTDWAAVLFLTPDPPPGTGLTMYKEDKTPDVVVENKFNRLVLFRGKKYHKSTGYFGDDKESGRLFQTFFFNAASPPLYRWNLTRPRVVAFMMSTNRYEYLERTLKSFFDNVSFEGCSFAGLFIVDDFPLGRDPDKNRALIEKYGVKIIEHETNEGLPASWRHGWDIVCEEHTDFVFQLEDDVDFFRPVNVRHMIDTYTNSKVPITQLALARQPVYPSDDFVEDIATGGHGETHPGFVTQSRYFLTLASLYPKDIVDRYPKDELPMEHTVATFFLDNFSMTGAVYGTREDLVHVHHLGVISRGKKGYGNLPDGNYTYDKGTRVTCMTVCIIPTRGRPHSIRRTLTACVDTADPLVSTKYRVLIDKNDPLMDSIKSTVAHFENASVHVIDVRKPLEIPDSDVVCFIGNDHRPHEFGWNSKLYVSAQSNDYIHGESSTISAVRSSLGWVPSELIEAYEKIIYFSESS